MNFTKVFRRHHHHHHHHSKQTPSPSSKPSLQYPRPFSYHIPASEQLSPFSRTADFIPYRIGLSSDSTLLTHTHTNATDDIIRLPVKHGRAASPKVRKDRRQHGQLNANKRWLFRSMEALDGWKGKVFPSKSRITNVSQSRSRSVENLVDGDPKEHSMMNSHSSIIEQQRARSPNRSIEALTHRVINSIGTHRKSANTTPHTARNPALTIKKQPLSTQTAANGHTGGPTDVVRTRETNASTVLDFREISSLGFRHSKSTMDEEQENSSLSPSDNRIDDLDSSDEEEEEVLSNVSFMPQAYDQSNEADDETADSWDFSITWIDSLKEQNSPQCKIQLYENLIKLLEQDTLNIDELLVLRKVLAKIWPTEQPAIKPPNDVGVRPDPKPNKSKPIRSMNSTDRRSNVPTMANHTAQRCSAVVERSPSMYETLHEQNSGHSSSSFVTAKATHCSTENIPQRTVHQRSSTNVEQTYPSHLNPFHDDTDIVPSAPQQDAEPQSNESIRRYFERLTLLETIYDKLNMEATKSTPESIDQPHRFSPYDYSTELPAQKYRMVDSRRETDTIIPIQIKHSPNHTDTSKTSSVASKFIEMNVDGSGSVNSDKSSLKRRAPKAPHAAPNNPSPLKNPTMFTLSSADLDLPPQVDVFRTRTHEKPLPRADLPREQVPRPMSRNSDIAASCDDQGQIFVYDPQPHPGHVDVTETLPRHTERIQQWLSSCEINEESNVRTERSRTHSPNTQLKMRCVAKPLRTLSSSPQRYPGRASPTAADEVEPGRFRSCLKVQLDPHEPTHPPLPMSPARQPTPIHEHAIIAKTSFPSKPSSSDFLRDHQAVFL